MLLLSLLCTLGSGCSDKGGEGASEIAVDVDLSPLSETMLIASITNIMTDVDEYLGKTIKMKGPYLTDYYNETKSYYHYVGINDAEACCFYGFEFVLNGEHSYPDDYPEQNAVIEIIGVFGSYEELGQIWYYIAVGELTIL